MWSPPRRTLIVLVILLVGVSLSAYALRDFCLLRGSGRWILTSRPTLTHQPFKEALAAHGETDTGIPTRYTRIVSCRCGEIQRTQAIRMSPTEAQDALRHALSGYEIVAWESVPGSEEGRVGERVVGVRRDGQRAIIARSNQSAVMTLESRSLFELLEYEKFALDR